MDRGSADFTDFTSCRIDHVFTFVKKVLYRSRVLSAFIKNIWKARNPGNKDGSYHLSFDYPRLIETSANKTSFFWVPNILMEIKTRVIIGESLPNRIVFFDEQTRMKWKYGWLVWSHLSFYYYFVNVYIYRKATKVQVKTVLKTSLEHILSTMILILIYLPRYFFLILVCLLMPVRKNLSVKLRLI